MSLKTLHKADCKKAWAKFDSTCPRCQELLSGAPRREGWGAKAKREEYLRIQAIRNHNCKECGCGPVCTAFDW